MDGDAAAKTMDKGANSYVLLFSFFLFDRSLLAFSLLRLLVSRGGNIMMDSNLVLPFAPYEG